MHRLVTIFRHLIIISTLFVLFTVQTVPATAHLLLAPHEPDEFTYDVSDTGIYAWINATSGQNAGFLPQDADDAFIGPVAIGFEFDFYEYAYSELYISTNGLITFGTGSSSDTENQYIPSIDAPSNFIAPFWDDLAVGGVYNNGAVYYQSGSDGNGKYFVVEWHQVTGILNDHKLTFEAVLHEDGKICFQYQTLEGASEGALDSATVGIEDADGIYGVNYLYNQSGLKDLEGTNSVCFSRPNEKGRVKAIPQYQSQFMQNRQAEFQINVVNIGEGGADVYDLTETISGRAWTVTYYQSDGKTPLTDSDGDGAIDTGPVSEATNCLIVVRVQAPQGVQSGDYTQLDLKFFSSMDTSNKAEVTLQAAIPATFTQIFSDSQLGLRLQRVAAAWQDVHPVVGDYTGSTMTLMATNSGYFLAWERNQSSYADIEFVLINASGGVIRRTTKLTDNSGVTQITLDHYPSSAVLPDGKVGVLWVRNVFNQDQDQNDNLYLAILDNYGNQLGEESKVTDNNGWRGKFDYEAPYFRSPHLLATGDNHFILTWTSDYIAATGEASDIYYAVYDRFGNVVMGPTVFAPSDPGVTKLVDPSLTRLGEDRAVLTYSIFDQVAGSSTVAYGILDSSGNIVNGEMLISGTDGRDVDGIQLQSGDVLLGWAGETSHRIHYALIDKDDYTVQSGPSMLESPYGRSAENVSVTADREGNAILTWMDDDQNDYLFYALVGPDGKVKTPSMIFQTGQALDPMVETSAAGEGNTFFVPGQIFLPHMSKQN